MTRGNVTIDLKARISGYEASLKQLQNAMSKIDLGSDIGKQLTRYIELARAQLKSLSKDLMPKASSDTQIDNIIDRVNQLGESVLNVAGLMQQIGKQDLNFGAFGNEISNLKKELEGLNADLQEKLDSGIRTAIDSSNELKTVFNDILRIDTAGKGKAELFKALEEGAVNAANRIKEAQSAVEKAQKNLTKKQNELDVLNANPFTDPERLKQQLINLPFNDIINKVQEGLETLFKNDENQINPLMDSFTKGLDANNLRPKIQQFVENIYRQLDGESTKQDIFSILFGVKKGHASSSNVEVHLLKQLKGMTDSVKEELKAMLSSPEFETALTREQRTRLITGFDEKEINEIIENIVNLIGKGNGRIATLIGEARNARNEALGAVTDAQQRASVAREEGTRITDARSSLEETIKQLTNNNQQLNNKINELEKRIETLQQGYAQQVRSQSGAAGGAASALRISTEEASKYKDMLQQVRAREQLIGRIEGVVQRWFSIYAAVRMVSNAIRSVISTVKELDKTITEIAIVTDMSQTDLWGQMEQYTEMARRYASSISGVYKVSQLYYQQGKLMV